MNDTYLEIIDIRTGVARKTGIAAAFDTLKETLRNFGAARALRVPGGGFLLDLYIDGYLFATIELDAAGVAAVSGETPESPEYYVAWDAAYWASRMRKSS